MQRKSPAKRIQKKQHRQVKKHKKVTSKSLKNTPRYKRYHSYA